MERRGCESWTLNRPPVNLTDTAEVAFGYARDAAYRLANGDNDGPAWVWHQCMGDENRQDFGRFLTQAQHPLAWEAGSPEWRFRAFVEDFARHCVSV